MRVNQPTHDAARFVEVISEAFPYIRRLSGQVIVIKCSGRVVADPDLQNSFARDIALLQKIGIQVIVVHGGGPQISQMIERLGMKNEFSHGMRVTDEATMPIVEMILSGQINSGLVGMINHNGGKAIGLSGRDASFIKARKHQIASAKGDAQVELGYVGEITSINVDVLHDLIRDKYIPIVAPIGVGEDGQAYNINADLVAANLAIALQCYKFVILTDTAGVLDEQQNLLTDLSLEQIKDLIERGVIRDGMLPKIQASTMALEGGVVAVQIIDGRIKHSILLELFSDQGIGSLLKA